MSYFHFCLRLLEQLIHICCMKLSFLCSPFQVSASSWLPAMIQTLLLRWLIVIDALQTNMCVYKTVHRTQKLLQCFAKPKMLSLIRTMFFNASEVRLSILKWLSRCNSSHHRSYGSLSYMILLLRLAFVWHVRIKAQTQRENGAARFLLSCLPKSPFQTNSARRWQEFFYFTNVLLTSIVMSNCTNFILAPQPFCTSCCWLHYSFTLFNN